MKKRTSLLLVLLLAVALSACAAPKEPAPPAKEPPAVEQNSEPEEAAPVIDYEASSPEDWIYLVADAEGPTALLNRINGVAYGSAGASLKELTAAAALLDLSRENEPAAAVRDFLTGMTPIQKDYFTFSWENLSLTASSLLQSPEELQPMLETAGLEDLRMEDYSQEALADMDAAVRKLFQEEGLTMVWKQHTDLVPFLRFAN